MIDFARVRRMMVDNQLRTYDITDLAVLAAMNDTPREVFVPDELKMLAYSDQPIVVARTKDDGTRALLPPMIFGRLVQNLGVETGDRALVVASGLGYEAVVLARLGARVTILESDPGIAESTRHVLAPFADSGIEIVTGPLAEGHADGAPYDIILINGAISVRPEKLLDQLRDGGRLGTIVGDGSRTSRATLFVRSGAVSGSRALFDAAAPSLPAFENKPGFVF